MDLYNRFETPLEELQLIAKLLTRVLRAEGHEKVRALLSDPDIFEEAVNREEDYTQFRSDHFDRRRINRRLKLYAEDNKE